MRLHETRFALGASYEVAFAPDESALFVAGARPRRWDLTTGRRTDTTWTHGNGLDVSPDGTRLVMTNTRGDVVMVDAATLDQLWVADGRVFGEGTAPRFTADGSAFVTCAWGGDPVVRSADTGAIVLHERVEGRMITELACSPDRLWFAQTGMGASVYVRRWPFTEHAARELVAVLSGRVLALDGDTLEERWSLPLPYASAAAYSPSGALLALGAWEQGVVLSRHGPGAGVRYDDPPTEEDDAPDSIHGDTDEEQWVIEYVEIEGGEGVRSIEHASSHRVGATRYDVWDVQGESVRWWAISPPLAAYDQREHPHAEHGALVPRGFGGAHGREPLRSGVDPLETRRRCARGRSVTRRRRARARRAPRRPGRGRARGPARDVRPRVERLRRGAGGHGRYIPRVRARGAVRPSTARRRRDA